MNDHVASESACPHPVGFVALDAHSSLEWEASSAFLVTWQDARTKNECVFGDLSNKPRAGFRRCFTAFGGADEPEEAVFAIHMPFKTWFGSKSTCDMYLAITAENLDTRDTASYYDTVVLPGVNEGKELVHCRLSLQNPGFVAMPVPQTRKRPSGHTRGALLSLKSLSQAMSFDIHLPLSHEATIQRFFQRLRSPNVKPTSLDLRTTFSERPVKLDAWDAYQILEEDTLPAGWNPLIEKEPPVEEKLPSYKKSDQPPQQGAAKDAPPASDLDDGHQPNEKLRPTVHFEDKPTAQVPEVHLDNNRPNRPPKKRKAAEALSDTEANPDDCPHPPLFQSGALQSLSELLFTADCVFDRNSRNHKLFSPSQFSWLCDAVLWLREAWTCHKDAHDSYLIELTAMTRAIRSNDRAKFEHIRLSCTDLFLKHDNKVGSRSRSETDIWDAKPTDRAARVGRWVYRRVGVGCDALILGELRALQESARRWRRVGGDRGEAKAGCADEYCVRELSFKTQMAGCILVACYKEGMHPQPLEKPMERAEQDNR